MNDMLGDAKESVDNTLADRRATQPIGIIKHLVLISISIIASFIVMARVKHGWSLEPLMWLAVVWYIPLLFVVDFAILRGRGRLGTLIVITTLTAMVIMFPFTEIEKANWRVRMNGMQGRAEYVRPMTFWNWWEIAPGKLIPNGLAWRVPVQGIPGRAHVFKILEEPGRPAAVQNRLFADSLSLSIVVEADSPDAKRQPIPKPASGGLAAPNTLIIRSKSPTQKSAIRPSGDWILEQVDCQNLRWLHIDGVNFSDSSWQQLLASKGMQRITLCNTNGSPQLFGDKLTYDQLYLVSLTHIDAIEVHDVTNMLSRSNRFREIQISGDLACEPLLPFLLKEPPPAYGAIVINRSDKGRAEIDESLDFSNRRLRLTGFRQFELDWICNHPLQQQPTVLELYECDFSAELLMSLKSLSILIVDCRMKRSEYDRMQTLLQAPSEYWDTLRKLNFNQFVDELIAKQKLWIVDETATP